MSVNDLSHTIYCTTGFTSPSLPRGRRNMCAFHIVVLIILTLFTCVHDAHAQSALEPLPPYFYLCSFHGTEQQPSLEARELTVSVTIEGNPSYYTPGQLYKVQVTTSRNFDSIHITGLYTRPSNVGSQAPSYYSNAPPSNSAMCSIVHSHISHDPKQRLEFMWMAPNAGTGCISFLASARLEQHNLFDHVTVLQLCEQPDEEAGWLRPPLMSLDADGVILREDFDSAPDWSDKLWTACDAVHINEECGVIIHGKAATSCEAFRNRQLITTALNLTTAAVLQFSIGSGTCRTSDGSEQMELYYSTDTDCQVYQHFHSITLPSNNDVTTHLLQLPARAKSSNTCLRWLQRVPANGSGHVGCWAIDNVLISNSAEPLVYVQDDFDPVTPANWLFFPGATIRHACHSDNKALVFDDVTQFHNYATTRDVDTSVSDVQATLTEDFEAGFSQSWVLEGGELNITCGPVHSNRAATMNGRSSLRRLCTPYMDLRQAGSTSFVFAQGRPQCSKSSGDAGSNVLVFVEDQYGHTVSLRTLPSNTQDSEEFHIPFPAESRNANARVCWIQKQHGGPGSDVWAVDHIQVFPVVMATNDLYVQFMVNMRCGHTAGNASMVVEYSTDHGITWFPLHVTCLPGQCHSHSLHSSHFDAQSVDSWKRVTLPVPVAALSTHTRFRFRQSSDAGESGWAVDRVYIGECERACSGHGHCIHTGCSCDVGFHGTHCEQTDGPLPTLLIDTMTTIPSITRHFRSIRGAGLAYRCGVLATGKALVFDASGPRELHTVSLNTTQAVHLQFSIRVGSESSTGQCPSPDQREEAVLLQVTCNGGVDWLTLKEFYGSEFRSPVLTSINVPESHQHEACSFRWWQPRHSGEEQDVWAIDDVSLTKQIYNTVELGFSDSALVEQLLDIHLGQIGSFCGRHSVLSFNDPYTDTDFRYVMTNSMQVGPSYVLEFELRMGCGSAFLDSIDNVVYLEFSLNHGMTWALVREGCWPPRMCEEYREASVYHSQHFTDWRRVSLTLPPHTWSSATRFRLRQAKWGSGDSWAVQHLYIGQHCFNLCHGHGYCTQQQCRCDPGYNGKDCVPIATLSSHLHSDFSLVSELDAHWLQLSGGGIVGSEEGCGTIVSGESLYFSEGGPRQLVTHDMDTTRVDFVQFHLKLGDGDDLSCYGVTSRGEHVLFQYSNDGGVTWSLLKELHGDDYSEPNLVHIELPKGAHSRSTRFRWWQPEHGGASTDQWAIDEVLISNYKHLNMLHDDFELQADSPATETLWQRITEGMFAPFCQSRSDVLMFADQGNHKVAMTTDLQLDPGDIVQFRINVGCSYSFSYSHPVLLEYSQDSGLSWSIVEKPCYVTEACHGQYSEGTVYYSGTHGEWTLVIKPLSHAVISKPVNFRWWQAGGGGASFGLDDVYIGPPCPYMCHGNGVCDHGNRCKCDRGFREPFCTKEGDETGVMMDRFEDRNEPISTLWASVVGGALGRGCGVIDSGSSLYFSDEGTREARTVPLNTTDIRFVQFSARIGSQDNHRGCQRPQSRDEAVIVDYSPDGGVTWHVLRTLDPELLSQGAQGVSIELPTEAKGEGTILRWWQPVTKPGTSRAEWALDSVVIAVNESSALGFEEHFNPMQNDVWYMAMNAVPRITCSSPDTALEFSKNAGESRLAETWDYHVTPSTFLQFDIAMGCSGAYGTLYDVMLEYSRDMGRHWVPVLAGCLPPRTDCGSYGYQQSSELHSAQHGNWTRVTLYLPDGAVSGATRFRWKQASVAQRGNVWALDNIYLGEGCPWLCSGHGYCRHGVCVCDPGYGGPFCVPTKPLPMWMRDDFEHAQNDQAWPEVHGASVTSLCGDLVSGDSLTFFKNGLRMAITQDLDVSMAKFIQFHFRYGCRDVASADWLRDHMVLLQYSHNGGIQWSNLQEIHYKDLTGPRYLSLELPSPARTTATRFRLWQPQHGGHMANVWSIDDFYIGGNVLTPDTIDEMFEMELNPDSFLFYPGGKIGSFCSYNTREDTLLAGSSAMVFERGAGRHSITTSDVLVDQMSVVQFDINVGCTAHTSRDHPVRLEYSLDLGHTWHLLIGPCGHSTDTKPCLDPHKDGSIYYPGESQYWQRVVIPLDGTQICGPARFRWYQGHFSSQDTSAAEWALDNVFIGMACQGHCKGHGVCVSGLFCQCDDGYGGETCVAMETRPRFLLDDFEGNDTESGDRRWLYASGSARGEQCGALLSGNSLHFSGMGARQAVTQDLDVTDASVIQFYIKLGCFDLSPYTDEAPVYLQYSTNGGISWRNLRVFDFDMLYGHAQYVAMAIPAEARSNATRFRWWQPSVDGAYLEDWAIDQVYIGGDINGRLKVEDELRHQHTDAWLMSPGAVVQPACGYPGNTLSFHGADTIRYAVTSDVHVTPSTYLQFDISVGCGNEQDQCFGIDLEYSTDLGQSWRPVLEQCAASDVDCVRFHDNSVYSSDVYTHWQRVTVHLPPHTQSLATRFRWVQKEPFRVEDTWALTNLYIGDECDCSCDGHGRCSNARCICDEGWTGNACSEPEQPLPTSLRHAFLSDVTPGDGMTSYGAHVGTECGVLAAGPALHFTGPCKRMLITDDLDLRTATLLQFYFRFGCLAPPTGRAENVLVEYSLNNGVTWFPLTELYYDQHGTPSYIMAEFPEHAKHNGVRIRWWQPHHAGSERSDWAIDNVFIGGKDENPDELKDDFNGNQGKEYPWIETDNAHIGPYCGSGFSVTGRAAENEAVTLTTIDAAVEVNFIIQFSISVGCNSSQHELSERVAPVHLQYSTDHGMTWRHLQHNCLPFFPRCDAQAQTASVYYQTGGWRRVTIPLEGDAVSRATRFRWRQTVDDLHPVSADWAIDDLYIGPACSHLCSGHGQCDYPDCICDFGFHGDYCQHGGSDKTYLKDSFNTIGDLDQSIWRLVQGGHVGHACAELVNGPALNLDGPGRRQVVTQDLDLRNARFIQYVAQIGGPSSRKGCGAPQSRNESVMLQYSSDAGITWQTLHVLDHSMYWREPHYDYIPLPLPARTRNTRFRWWQLVGDDPEHPPVSWALDDVYIGGHEINPAHMEDDFNDVLDEEEWEFHPNSGTSLRACGRSSPVIDWTQEAGLKSIHTQQLIVQEGYMIQFKIQVGCKSAAHACSSLQGVSLMYNRDPHVDEWQLVYPRCLLNSHEQNMHCVPYRFHEGSTYTANQEGDLSRITLQLPPRVFSANTRFKWIQAGTEREGPAWALDDVYIGEKCPGLCGGRGDCVNRRCECDTGYVASGDSCHPHRQNLIRHFLDSFETAHSPSKWARVDGGGVVGTSGAVGGLSGGVSGGVGCGTLRPAAYGKNLYFNGCGVRQAITAELDLTRVSKVMFVLRIGSAQQSPSCNIDVTRSSSNGWVFLQYSLNKGIDWQLLATHDPHKFLAPQMVGYPLPLEASAAGVQLRWWQPEHRGAGYDQWAIDQVETIMTNQDLYPRDRLPGRH